MLVVGKQVNKIAENWNTWRNASPRDSLWACLQWEKRREEVGIQKPYLGGSSLLFYGPKWAAPPLFRWKPVENQQAKLAGNATKQPENLRKFPLVKTRNFRYKNLQIKDWYVTYSKT